MTNKLKASDLVQILVGCGLIAGGLWISLATFSGLPNDMVFNLSVTVAAVIGIWYMVALSGGASPSPFFTASPTPVYIVPIKGDLTVESLIEAIRGMNMSPVVVQTV